MWGVAAEQTTAVVANQQALLKDQDRVEKLLSSYESEARLIESFIVLTIGAILIANFDVLANNEAVVIGAIYVAPWMLPLRMTVFTL